MQNRDLTSIPKEILIKCFDVQNFSAFVLPNISNNDAIKWEKILLYKLSNIYNFKENNISVSITLYDFNGNFNSYKLVTYSLFHFIKLILPYLLKDKILLISFNNHIKDYCFLIVPGIQISEINTNK